VQFPNDSHWLVFVSAGHITRILVLRNMRIEISNAGDTVIGTNQNPYCPGKLQFVYSTSYHLGGDYPGKPYLFELGLKHSTVERMGCPDSL
jgi:hypothetical protein